MPREELAEWAEATGVAVDDDGWARLETLIGLWQRYARAMNLFGRSDRGSLVEHVREGLMAVAAVERAGVGSGDRPLEWLDVGSGAGLPGLVVGAVRAWRLTLVEPRERRANFLRLAINTVARDENSVRRGNIGRGTWNDYDDGGGLVRRIGEFDVCSARAVFTPVEWCEIGTSWCRAQGVVLLHVAADSDHVVGETLARVAFDGWAVQAVRPGTAPGGSRSNR
jgi:16S rRNA G527 N7-methylase RsmG